MAEVISDFIPDSSRFHHHHHTMIAGSGSQRSPAEQYRQRSKSRPEVPPSPRPQPQPQAVPSVAATGTPPPSTRQRAAYQGQEDVAASSSVKTDPPSPPSSSSPNPGSYTRQQFTSQQHFPPSSAPYKRESYDVSTGPTLKTEAPLVSPPIPRSVRSLDDMPNHGNTIKVRDLAHIQNFANDEYSSYGGQHSRRRTADDPALKYEISAMPITDIIEMVAGLLTKITTTNDRQHENLHRPLPSGDNAVNMSGLSSSVLAFHGKNVPSITILSYLSRIHKYCPTTYEVFLSLLVYFDRMTERVNAQPLQALRRDSMEQDNSRPSTSYSADGSDLADSPPMPATSRSMPEIKEDLEKAQYPNAPAQSPALASEMQFPLSHFFVVDSFNIHRLVIAGVTCASKFFSDVFYTNSRYAKVCLSLSPSTTHLLSHNPIPETRS